MIILDSTTESLEILLAGTVTTNQLPFTVSYADHNAAAPSFTPGSSDGQTNNTTAVALVGNPGAGVQRQVKRINVYNADTAQATVTIRLNNGGTLRTMLTVALQTGERIEYEDSEGFRVFTVTGAVKVTAVQSTVEPGYIDGMTMQWDSATQMTIASGTCYIPSVGANVNFTSALTKTPTLSASTFYHVYAFLNSGVPDVEIVTTVPSSPYNGTARTKTGDTTRRYIGSVLTNASSQLYRFVQSNLDIQYLETIGGGTPFRILSAGAATTRTAVSASAAIPVTSKRGEFQFINSSAGSQFLLIGAPDLAVVDTISVAAGLGFVAYFPLVNGQLGYYLLSAGGSAFIDVHGYSYER